ncbi:hypothetical protein N0V90_001125 [Kalmusia sp. IMI 367209]|nr:hypothetical protein N0V90_001125 [Kalmusia sp. IMI 367209]
MWSMVPNKLSSLFMEIGRSAPRHQEIALLYPQSRILQKYLSEYFVVVVTLCTYLFEFGQKSIIQQFTSALNDSNLKTFRTDLDSWANSIKAEMHLNEAQKNSESRALARKLFKSVTHQQKLASNLRVLNFCSTYKYQTAWKQIRKFGNATVFTGSTEYKERRDSSDPGTLVYTGKLGSGKSVMLANIVDDLNIFAEKGNDVIAYLFL